MMTNDEIYAKKNEFTLLQAAYIIIVGEYPNNYQNTKLPNKVEIICDLIFEDWRKSAQEEGELYDSVFNQIFPNPPKRNINQFFNGAGEKMEQKVKSHKKYIHGLERLKKKYHFFMPAYEAGFYGSKTGLDEVKAKKDKIGEWCRIHEIKSKVFTPELYKPSANLNKKTKEKRRRSR